MKLNNRGLTFQSFTTGALVAFVGFSSSFAIVVQGLEQMGANKVQATSALMMLSFFMGIGGIILSLKTKIPISVAWSTPGGAFLIASALPNAGFAEAVGAFILAAVMAVMAGFFRPLTKLVAAIPKSIANAMLAGIITPLCLAPFQLIDKFPVIGLVMFFTWLIVSNLNKVLAVPAMVMTAGLCIYLTIDADWGLVDFTWQMPELVKPVFSLASFVSISIPLVIITMASQNITGIAVLNSYDYKPNVGSMFRWTGFLSLLCAPFGGHGVNLAAVTAAMCAGEDAGENREARYWASFIAGIVYIIFGLMAVIAVSFISLSPPIIITAVAGIALFGALAGALSNALSDSSERQVAIITFLITSSGVSLFGIGGAFWGLVVGTGMYLWTKFSESKSIDKPLS